MPLSTRHVNSICATGKTVGTCPLVLAAGSFCLPSRPRNLPLLALFNQPLLVAHKSVIASLEDASNCCSKTSFTPVRRTGSPDMYLCVALFRGAITNSSFPTCQHRRIRAQPDLGLESYLSLLHDSKNCEWPRCYARGEAKMLQGATPLYVSDVRRVSLLPCVGSFPEFLGQQHHRLSCFDTIP